MKGARFALNFSKGKVLVSSWCLPDASRSTKGRGSFRAELSALVRAKNIHKKGLASSWILPDARRNIKGKGSLRLELPPGPSRNIKGKGSLGPEIHPSASRVIKETLRGTRFEWWEIALCYFLNVFRSWSYDCVSKTTLRFSMMLQMFEPTCQ